MSKEAFNPLHVKAVLDRPFVRFVGEPLEIDRAVASSYYAGLMRGLAYISGEFTEPYTAQTLEDLWQTYERLSNPKEKAVFAAGLALAHRLSGNVEMATAYTQLYTSNLQHLNSLSPNSGTKLNRVINAIELVALIEKGVPYEYTMVFQFDPEAREARRLVNYISKTK